MQSGGARDRRKERLENATVQRSINVCPKLLPGPSSRWQQTVASKDLAGSSEEYIFGGRCNRPHLHFEVTLAADGDRV